MLSQRLALIVGTTDGMDEHAEEAAVALGGNVNQHGGFYFQEAPGGRGIQDSKARG